MTTSDYGRATRRNETPGQTIEQLYRWGYGKDDRILARAPQANDDGGSVHTGLLALALALACVALMALFASFVAGGSATAFAGIVLGAAFAGVLAGTLGLAFASRAFPEETRAQQPTPRARRTAIRYRTTA